MCLFAGEKYRGWTVAEAKGLFLHRVRYDGDLPTSKETSVV